MGRACAAVDDGALPSDTPPFRLNVNLAPFSGPPSVLRSLPSAFCIPRMPALPDSSASALPADPDGGFAELWSSSDPLSAALLPRCCCCCCEVATGLITTRAVCPVGICTWAAAGTLDPCPGSPASMLVGRVAACCAAREEGSAGRARRAGTVPTVAGAV